VAEGYGRWISWLAENGALDPHSSPGERVEPDRVRAYVDALRAINAPATVLSRIQELYLALTVIAPERDWTWIRQIETRFKRTVVPALNKRTGLPSSERLYALGLTLMTEAETRMSGTLQAVQYRDGLMISLLAARPLRRHNFAAMDIGRHLLRQGDGYWIRFQAAETKTHIPIEVPFPAALVPYLERYLSTHRPRLAECEGYWRTVRALRPLATLWLSQHGTPMSEVAISGRFKKLTRDRLGQAISMHRFRDSAATSIAIEDPEHVRITMCILGHTTLRTSERHYNHATSLQAIRRYQATILERRRSLSSRFRSVSPQRRNPGAISLRPRTMQPKKGR
jgi:site-specific recombinase XerD